MKFVIRFRWGGSADNAKVYFAGIFWVRKNQIDQVGAAASTVDLGSSSVGRTTMGGKLIGGRVYDRRTFMGSLDGIEYPDDNNFEVKHIS